MIGIPFEKIQWDLVYRINEQINRLPQVSDLALYGRNEFWAMAQSAGGDCEDLVLRKRYELKRLGLSGDSLLPATGTLWNGEGHAVLLIDTSQGAYVLDNLTDEIKGWRDVRMDWYGRADWHSLLWRSMDA